MQQEQTTRLQLLMNNVTCNEAISVTVNMSEVLAIVVAVIVIFAIVVSAIVVTSTGTHSNFSHSDCTHSGFNLNCLRLPMAVTTVVIVVILPSNSFFNFEVEVSAATVTECLQSQSQQLYSYWLQSKPQWSQRPSRCCRPSGNGAVFVLSLQTVVSANLLAASTATSAVESTITAAAECA